MKLYFTILLLNITFICFSQSECHKLKNGKFYYPTMPSKKTIREKGIQKSYSEDKLEIIWKVKWLNDCKYVITCTEVLNNSIPVKAGDKIIVTILSFDENCYYSSLEIFDSTNPSGLELPNGPFPLCREDEL